MTHASPTSSSALQKLPRAWISFLLDVFFPFFVFIMHPYVPDNQRLRHLLCFPGESVVTGKPMVMLRSFSRFSCSIPYAVFAAIREQELRPS